jgi:hypothetical protein
MPFLLKRLKELRECTEEHAHQFTSDGFSTLFALLVRELNNEYLARAHEHLAESKFRKGVMLSAEVGEWNESTNLVLRKPSYGNQNRSVVFLWAHLRRKYVQPCSHLINAKKTRR